MKSSIAIRFSVINWIFLLATLGVLFGCGDNPIIDENNTVGANSAGISTKIVLGAPPSSASQQNTILEAPSGDICVDYKIENIRATLEETDGSYKKSELVPCDQRNVTFESCPYGTNLKLTLEGLVEGKTGAQWRSSDENDELEFVLKSGEGKNLGTQTLDYVGDDATPPEVESNSPVENELEVDLNSNITITFSEDIIPASIKNEMIDLHEKDGKNGIACLYSYDENTYRATITPEQELAPETTYVVTIDCAANKILDRVGNALNQQEISWEFTSAPDRNVWYVDPDIEPVDGTDLDGTKWGTAFNDIQDAVDSANLNQDKKNEIWVKRGVFRIRSPIEITSPVSIFGGFAGNESKRSNRDWHLNVTSVYGGRYTLGVDTPGIVIQAASVIIDGIKVTGCSALYAEDFDLDGGIIIDNVTEGDPPSIRNCIIAGNESIFEGAGIYIRKSKAEIVNCLISNNVGASSNDTCGGIYVDNGIAVSIKNCTIVENSGFGLYVKNDAGDATNTVELINSILWNNTDFDENYKQYSFHSNGNIDVFDCLIQDGINNGGINSGDPINHDRNKSDDPLLAPDFHLKTNSPCIDQGNNGYDLSDEFGQIYDVHGESRSDGTIDIGADEFIDTDSDGMPDYWENLYGLRPSDSSDRDEDPDGDEFTNIEEYLSGTDPIYKTVTLNDSINAWICYDFDKHTAFREDHFEKSASDICLEVPADPVEFVRPFYFVSNPDSEKHLMSIEPSQDFKDITIEGSDYKERVYINTRLTYVSLYQKDQKGDHGGYALIKINRIDYDNETVTFSYENHED